MQESFSNDPDLGALLEQSLKLQHNTLNLIASENIAPPGVRAALASSLMDKYAEGYPGKRYYPGNSVADQIELLAIQRAKEAFRLNDTWEVNVQPYSGSSANFEVYNALLNPGDTFLAMSLASGGHLTHGHKASATGKYFSPIHYTVDAHSGRIDYETIAHLAASHRPKIIVSGFTAYPRQVDFERIGRIARDNGALHMADISHIAGLVVADLHPSPFPYADIVTTTTHKTLRGTRGAVIFMKKEFADAINKSVFPGLQGGPHLNSIAAKAHTFYLARQREFKDYQMQVVKNAALMAEFLQKQRGGILTGGTDTHLFLLDANSYGMDGMTAEKLLEECGIIANRNSLPKDSSPFKPNGIRFGTPAITSRGFKDDDAIQLASLIHRILARDTTPGEALKETYDFTSRFPIE